MGKSSTFQLGSGYLNCCFIINCLVLFSATSAIGGTDTDRLALLEFRNKISVDPFGAVSSWNDTIHFCLWYGVKCSRRHERVTVLDLNSLQLQGTISPHIGNLSFLKILDLKNNSFTRSIPPEIGRLGRLQTLYLYNNSLTGTIPSNLSRCSSLSILSLVNNKLIGQVPPELGLLSKLRFLSISKNNLTGNIPPSLGNLSSLLTLSAALNNFVGPIPDTLGRLKNLTFLGLVINQLSGTIPSSIFNLSSITVLDIGDNKIEGHLPSDLFTSFPNLRVLSFAVNQFTGRIPSSISNVTNLSSLQLNSNNLIGDVPFLERLDVPILTIDRNNLGNGKRNDLMFLCSLRNASSLVLLDISRNNFGGLLPQCIANLSVNLKELSLHVNQISGILPYGISNLVNLQRLRVYKNNLSGSIPQSIGNLQNLVELILDQNKFFGPIPVSIGNMTRLNRLHLADNNLQGTIPLSLADCRNLQVLDFSRNSLNGTLPPQVIGLSSLSIYLGFAENNLTGSLPSEIGNLKALGIFDISKNMLSGDIPSTLGSCVSLEYLYMQENHFQGSIPSSLRSLRGLIVLNLSNNSLSGQIPEFLASFEFLLNLFLSFNHFEGMVPTGGVLKNASITTVEGNSKLCGGIPEFNLPACNFKRNGKRRYKVLIIATVSGISCAIILLLCFLLFIRSRKKIRQLTASSISENSLLNLPNVSYRDLHKATDGFSSENLIGSGSFGSVYKGNLGADSKMVAIKVLNLQNHGAAKSFIAECEALRNIRHRNLVKVLTACSSVDNQGNDFKALVYEFMVNGSLEEWLHPSSIVTKNFNILQRLKIGIDVASAIEYLHHNCGTALVHCDIKPSNVLLDENMTARIGDFGLAKFLLESIQNSSSNQISSAGLRGTIGYAPPEYGLGSAISTYGDVYSYGILLLEMFTGKRPTDETFKESWNIHIFAASAFSNGETEVIDSVLLQEIVQLEMTLNSSYGKVRKSKNSEGILTECLMSIIGIGIACSSELPADRMGITDAVTELCVIIDKIHAIYAG
ncbi:putative receptor-like protein kinase At3g47110 [Mercurialis annua]|uniref:putative receptor-like protein kinase At3g47110 n=1 Tax=Mercurialis annua TaxID=3986 RepID=UPI00215F1AD4|nr:putative receptor-like protein kinase At3g47110 [Mercurialis annua]